MDRIPGVLLYKISNFCDLTLIVLIESMSSTLKSKLHGNKSAFGYYLRKVYGLNSQNDWIDYIKVLYDA